MNWIDATDDYQLSLDGSKLVCRNRKGKVLASVPKPARESAVGEKLLEVRDWLVIHERDCRDQVQRWMLRSLPVPIATLQSVWPDPSWRQSLENLVVSGSRVGFLRDCGPNGLGLVDLDGESHWIGDATVLLPHPILIPELDGFRELMTELQLTQSTAQLFRETWQFSDGTLKSSEEWSGGRFAQTLHAHSRAKNLGYPVKGGFATCSIWHQGAVFEARYWIGSDSPEQETVTGELSWVDSKEAPVSVATAGPVAYSEGCRMASQIYAGRLVEKENQ